MHEHIQEYLSTWSSHLLVQIHGQDRRVHDMCTVHTHLVHTQVPLIQVSQNQPATLSPLFEGLFSLCSNAKSLTLWACEKIPIIR